MACITFFGTDDFAHRKQFDYWVIFLINGGFILGNYWLYELNKK